MSKNIRMNHYPDGVNKEHIYPITLTKNVFNNEGDSVDSILDNLGVDGLPLILGKEQGVKSGDDVTVELQALIEQAKREERSILIPDGIYYVSSTILVEGLPSLEIEGNSMLRSQLVFTGTGNMFFIKNVGEFRLRKITIRGNTSDPIRPNTTLFESHTPITATECYFKSWDRLLLWKGGYYYKFINCRIFRFRMGLENINSNNVLIQNCRVNEFHTFLITRGGNGPINVINSSFEKFTHRGFVASAGSKPIINVSGCYIENYPQQTPPSDLGGNYDGVFFISNFVTANFRGNMITTRGLRRFFYSSQKVESLISIGNYIMYQAVSDLDYFFIMSGTIGVALCMDTALNVLTGLPQTYTSQYIAGTQKYGAGSVVVNPFNSQVMS